MSGPKPLLVIGDAILDRDLEGRVERLCPDAPVPVVDGVRACPRPGGAALAAALAAASGRRVTLLTAIGCDLAGAELLWLLDRAGVEVIDLVLDGATPEKVRVRAEGRTLVRIDRGSSRPAVHGRPGEPALRALAEAGTVLFSDYAWGLAADLTIRRTLESAGDRIQVVWDPHQLGSQPIPGCRLVTPNRREADARGPLAEVAARGRELRRRLQAAGVAITLGAEGAILVTGEGPPLMAPAPVLSVGDSCAAGDQFAATAAGVLADGGTLEDGITLAVAAASAFVAAGGAASFGSASPLTPSPGTGLAAAQAVIAATRARGGRVVVTGGCFDLLHAGHLASLSAARRLGDCLIVCLNSDSSVRRLKGQGRPVVPEDDRASVLEGLRDVDAVVVFDEDTPAALLRRLRPDIFAKGSDHTMGELPERELIASWGGDVVLLPIVAGHSTTGLVERVRSSAGD